MPTKIPRKRRREIRGLVNAIVATKLQQINLEGFTDPTNQEEVDYAMGYLQANILSFSTRAALALLPEDGQ